MGICKICGKETTSHRIGDYFVCHSCWENRREEVEKLVKEVKEEFEEPLRKLENNEKGGMVLVLLIHKFAMKFYEEIRKATKEYGKKIKDENEFTVFLNWFSFERKIEGKGKTPSEIFMEEYQMPEWLKERIKAMQKPVTGLFEVKKKLPDNKFTLRNVMDGKEYTLFGIIKLNEGDFVGDEIYPWGEVYITGGAISLYSKEEAEKIMGIVREYEKLSEKIRELKRNTYADFVEYFGRWDPLFPSVDDAKKALNDFTVWRGVGRNERKEPPSVPAAEEKWDVAAVCYPEGEVHLLPDYGKFKRMVEGKDELDREYMKESFLHLPVPALKKLMEESKSFANVAGKVFDRDVSNEKIDDFMREIRSDWQ